ncbi:hypothetical protein ABTQ33_13280 (plasmid) [Paucilactobacillus suebicus]|uniref:transposase n=1 Tax=Paucilactobacillus suebicus TaxID=152335 RepID=UPI0002490E91|nr:transposase [Paucilactobacillus suebicus]
MRNVLSNLEQEFPVTFKMVRRVMRELGLRWQACMKKHSFIKQHEKYILDNVLNQNFDVSAPNEVWLSDSTKFP